MTRGNTDADLFVIGGGEAGFSAALAGAALGLRVILADDGADDPCWRNWDVILAALRHAGREAIRLSSHRDDAIAAVGRDLRAALAAAGPDRRFARLGAMNIRVLRGHARFAGPDVVHIKGAPYRARRIVLAVGSAANTGDDAVARLLDPVTLPRSLAVEGSGPRSVAIAQALRRLGCDAVLQPGAGLLPSFDPEVVAALERVLHLEGVLPDPACRLAECRDVLRVEAAPALDDLDLGRGGVDRQGGSLLLSPSLRTTNPRVFAIGALGGARTSETAQAQVGVVMKAAFFRLPARYDPTRIPICVLTDPTIAAVGLGEAEARTRGPISIGRWPYAETVAASVEPGVGGFVKVVSDGRGRILGASIVHRDAAEHIGFWALALQSGRTLAEVAELGIPSTAFMDASRRVAVQHAVRRLQNPWLKRALHLLGRLG